MKVAGSIPGTVLAPQKTKKKKGKLIMFNNMGLGMGMKSARVGDQIDAEVKGGKSVIANAKMVAQQFDFVETQLTQFSQMLQQQDPMVAMQFQNMTQQINNIQAQLVGSLTQVDQTLTSIDQLTDRIQN